MILADVVWPSLYLVDRLFAWWIIGAGLLIEWAFVFRLTRSTLLRAGAMTVVMNVISTLVGIVGIPLSGIIWEFVAAPLFNLGTFSPITWFVSCVLAALLSTVVETASLCLIFRVAWTRRLFWWLALANAITTGMALISIMLSPTST